MSNNERGIVKITDIEYLQLLKDTAEEKRDPEWCMKMKIHLKKLQYLTGYKLSEQIEKVDLRFNEIQNGNEII